ncbi:unnamed protein product [Scytosiphon promiscuus]
MFLFRVRGRGRMVKLRSLLIRESPEVSCSFALKMGFHCPRRSSVEGRWGGAIRGLGGGSASLLLTATYRRSLLGDSLCGSWRCVFFLTPFLCTGALLCCLPGGRSCVRRPPPR